jgi:alpha-amylase/alpha-mannosidase (GH57 family)
MKKVFFPRLSTIVVAVVLSSCTPAKPADDILYLNLLWHQHQPLYYKDENSVYTRPWVRVHATKDYYDMASTVAEYPDVHVTFNLTPVLLRQLEDFADNDAKDVYWVLAEKSVAELTQDEKRFILERFFDANWTNIIGRFPRYQQLLDQRGGATPEEIDRALEIFSEQDLRDLQVWFNLAWFDPDFLAVSPLRELVDKGEGFSEQDKAALFSEARRIIGEVIPLHRQLQQDGQIEVITSPYAHPILPLLYSTKLALTGNPGGEAPERFSYPNDAIAQLQLAADEYTERFGREPGGQWPSEGAVAEEIVSLVANAGFDWMASGEQVLAQSLGIGAFTRDADETVQEADALYRPYFVQGDRGEPVMVVFRDLRLSDLIGFEYSQTPGEEAAADFLGRLEDIRQQLEADGATGPHLVSVILDGENAWEYYPNDGKAFFEALYRGLSESETIRTVTPGEYLEMFPEQETLETLFPGAWFSPNYDTWIGESEETKAWEYLLETRKDLGRYDLTGDKTAPSPEALETALDFMYLAEGSDWFWWYGADQNSGNDDYFDRGFRALLAGVYESLGEERPPFVSVPILPSAPAAATRPLQGTFTPLIDGQAAEDEWAQGAAFNVEGGAQARAEDIASGLLLGADKSHLYVAVPLKPGWEDLADLRGLLYIDSPRLEASLPFRLGVEPGTEEALIGFGATTLIGLYPRLGIEPSPVVYQPFAGQWQESSPPALFSSTGLELAIPLEMLGELEPGDELRFLVDLWDGTHHLQDVPASGPATLVLPDLGQTTPLFEVIDPAGDDHGPGTYAYPTDTVFEPRVFDLSRFAVGVDERNLVFTFDLHGPITNPWGSPNGLALQTLDVYVDKDPGAGTGPRLLLPGRNAALADGYGWEVAIWAEGWTPQFVVPDDDGNPKQDGTVTFKVIADPANQRFTLRVPRAAFGDGDPGQWAFAAVLLSQDGFPSAGVWRVRDVATTAQQWRLGGGPDDANHTRILDLAWAEGAASTQESMLSAYPSSPGPLDGLEPEDFPQIEMLRP